MSLADNPEREKLWELMSTRGHPRHYALTYGGDDVIYVVPMFSNDKLTNAARKRIRADLRARKPKTVKIHNLLTVLRLQGVDIKGWPPFETR